MTIEDTEFEVTCRHVLAINAAEMESTKDVNNSSAPFLPFILKESSLNQQCIKARGWHGHHPITVHFTPWINQPYSPLLMKNYKPLLK